MLSQAIKKAAFEVGFDLVGVAAPDGLPEDLCHLTEWLEKGYHGKMAWMEREPEVRADVRLSLPQAGSVIMLGLNYFQGEKKEQIPAGHGRVSRYARGKDYHHVIEEKLKALLAILSEFQEPVERNKEELFAWRTFVDAGPLLERQYAERAGLGFIGKNTLLINPNTGSYYFLAALAISWKVTPDSLIEGTCGQCTRCLEACPTGAFPKAGVLDAQRCISYLTIEMRDEITDPSLQQGIGDWIFGCDVCQDVCPYNKFAVQTNETNFLGPASIDLRALAQIRSNREFNQKYEGSPVVRARRKGLQRSAIHILANQAERQVELNETIEAEKPSWVELDQIIGEFRALLEEEKENPELGKSLASGIKRYQIALDRTKSN